MINFEDQYGHWALVIMVKHFGDEYRDYRKRVPMFVPRWGEWRHLLGGAPSAHEPSGGEVTRAEEMGR